MRTRSPPRTEEPLGSKQLRGGSRWPGPGPNQGFHSREQGILSPSPNEAECYWFRTKQPFTVTAKHLEIILMKLSQSPDEPFPVLSQTREARLGGQVRRRQWFLHSTVSCLSLGSDPRLPANTGVCAVTTSKCPVIALTLVHAMPETLSKRQLAGRPLGGHARCVPATGVRAMSPLHTRLAQLQNGAV